MNKIIPGMAALLMLTVGCGPREAANEEPKAVEMQARIAAMEDSLFAGTSFDERNAQALLDVYKRYAATFPLDSMAPEYLFRAAGVAKALYDGYQGIFIYDRITIEYPGWEKIPEVYYMKAFTLDSDLGIKGEAQQAYKDVINNFPEHPFARDAAFMLENLHLTDAELIERFKAMQPEGDGEVPVP